MDTTKKLIITIATVLFITFGFSSIAYATEITNIVDSESNKETDLILNINGQDEDVSQDEDESQGIGQDEDESQDIGQDHGDIHEGDIEGFSEDLLDTEAYEIYIDEQGQIFYLEKKPVEPEIDDSDEIIQDEETEKETDKEQEKKQKTAKKEKKPTYTEKELRLLASLVYCEAGNQSYEGMLAVANVVLNRVKSDVYYHVNTIKEVIYDRQWAVQFSVTKKNSKTGKSMLDKALDAYDTGKFSSKNPEAERKAMNKAIKAAKAALEGENNIGKYMCFRMNNSDAKRTKNKYKDHRILGDHVFYRTK